MATFPGWLRDTEVDYFKKGLCTPDEQSITYLVNLKYDIRQSV